MYGVTFGNKHSYEDYQLILTAYDTGEPAPRRNLVPVPGRNGLLDTTEALTPVITYDNRQMQFAFTWRSSPETYEEELQVIRNALHGKKMHVILDSDLDYYYDGFVTIASKNLSGRERASIVIAVDAYPYKLRKEETVMTKSGSGTLVCQNDRMEVIPTIQVTANTSITFGTDTYTLSAGTHTVAGIQFSEGDNELVISGSGTTTIKYRQGRL